MRIGRVLATVLAAVLLSACGSDDVLPEATTGSGASDTVPATTVPTTDDASDTDAETTVADQSAAKVADDTFPSVIDAKVTSEGDRAYSFAVTISSPYDSPDRYADAWRVLGPDGEEYGIRVLTHDHASEQPFTRSQSGIVVPEGIDSVTIEGRDLSNGWGGQTFELAIPESP